jgi:Hydantoinase B/oxoprolinase
VKRFDPTTLEIYRALYTSVAEEMGIALRRTPFSPNIKERRDYSCAVFDANGRVIAQGDHMPIHLGSMPMAVAAALRDIKPEPGDVVALNDPFAGGTHLPDVTLVMPVFLKKAESRKQKAAKKNGAPASCRLPPAACRLPPVFSMSPTARITPTLAAVHRAQWDLPRTSTVKV